MPKGALIGKGMTAEVFEWSKDRVLKLFDTGIPLDYIQYEADIGRAVYEAGISALAVFDIIEESNRKGILYERIIGESLLELIRLQPFKVRYYGRLMAQIHAKINTAVTNKLPTQQEHFEWAISQSESILGAKTGKIIDYLYQLPNGASVCHGDFHPDNIIITNDNSKVIDWANAYIGCPLSDVARTCLMLRSPFSPTGTSRMMPLLAKVLKRLIYKAYLKEYLEISRVKFEEINQWILPVAAARLRENLPGEKDWLLRVIRKHEKTVNSSNHNKLKRTPPI